jgi:hypothetical protein
MGSIVELVRQSFGLVDAPAVEVTKALEQLKDEGLIL